MHRSDATATKHTGTTATALQLHCTSGSHWGWSRFPVVSFFQVVGQVGRSVAQLVEVTPNRCKDRGGWSQRLQEQCPKTSQILERQSLKKSSRPGLSSETGQVKASATQTYWPVQCDGTSEGFWKSSRTGLSHPAGEDK